jgi:cupin superfamily acireductone dioxygenase involved in methionine salvage
MHASAVHAHNQELVSLSKEYPGTDHSFSVTISTQIVACHLFTPVQPRTE